MPGIRPFGADPVRPDAAPVGHAVRGRRLRHPGLRHLGIYRSARRFAGERLPALGPAGSGFAVRVPGFHRGGCGRLAVDRHRRPAAGGAGAAAAGRDRAGPDADRPAAPIVVVSELRRGQHAVRGRGLDARTFGTDQALLRDRGGVPGPVPNKARPPVI